VRLNVAGLAVPFHHETKNDLPYFVFVVTVTSKPRDVTLTR
jgi:hypothetical protein